MAGRRRTASLCAAPSTHWCQTVPIIAVTRRRGKWQAEPAQSARCRDKPHRAVDKPPWVVYVYRAGNPDCLERGYDQPIDHLGGGADDASDLALALVVSVVLMLLVVLSRWLCRGGKATPLAAKSPRAKRDPKPFAGFTRKSDCRAYEQDAECHPTALTPNAPPPRMTFTRGRHRHVETTGHFCSTPPVRTTAG
jgi:hypothetical protein